MKDEHEKVLGGCCPYCSIALVVSKNEYFAYHITHSVCNCPSCGYSAVIQVRTIANPRDEQPPTEKKDELPSG